MDINVFVEPVDGMGYRATSLTIAGFAAEAATRDEAIQLLKQQICSRFKRGELTTIAVPFPGEQHPLLAAFGRLRNHPDLAEVEENIRERRRQLDADPNWP